MKRIAAFILTMVLIICIGSVAFAYTTMYVYTSNGKSLNLRDAPSMYGNVMTTIPYGAAVRVNDSFDDTWYSVSYGAYTGYSMARYLVTSYTPYVTYCPTVTPTPTPTSATTSTGTFPNEIFADFESAYYQVLVRPSNPAGYVNMRWAPTLQADIQTRYYANEVLTVVSENSVWCQVMDEEDHVIGFMMRQFLTAYSGDS